MSAAGWCALLRIIVSLFVSTQAGVTPSAIRDLQTQVAAIYANAGVDIEWAKTTKPGALQVNVLPVLPPIAGCELAFGCSVIDSRNVNPSVAYIASATILQYRLANPRVSGQMLAYVTVHEVGHLLGLQHSNDRGIMHRNIDWLLAPGWAGSDKSALSQKLAASLSARYPAVNQHPIP